MWKKGLAVFWGVGRTPIIVANRVGDYPLWSFGGGACIFREAINFVLCVLVYHD